MVVQDVQGARVHDDDCIDWVALQKGGDYRSIEKRIWEGGAVFKPQKTNTYTTPQHLNLTLLQA